MLAEHYYSQSRQRAWSHPWDMGFGYRFLRVKETLQVSPGSLVMVPIYKEEDLDALIVWEATYRNLSKLNCMYHQVQQLWSNFDDSFDKWCQELKKEWLGF